MGTYDTINGYVNCPYCGVKHFTENQTKKLICRFQQFEPGSTISGGPYLNGLYPLNHEQSCDQCGMFYNLSFSINNQIISSLDAFKTVVFQKKSFDIEINRKDLILLIRQNCITTILLTHELAESYDYDAHMPDTSWTNNSFFMLTDYVDLYAQKYFDCNVFIGEVFDNLEDTLTWSYLDLVNIDFSKIYNFNLRSNTDESHKNEYDDLITYLQTIIKANKHILKDQISDYYKNCSQTP